MTVNTPSTLLVISLFQNSEDFEALRFEPSSTLSVLHYIAGLAVLRSIDLDDKLRGQASEVRNVVSNGDLATKVAAEHGRLAQMVPQLRFRRSRIRTQPTRSLATE